MKTRITILLIVLLNLSTRINAQEPPKTYHEQMKILMSELDSTRFKNNILYNKVYPLANLNEFNQNGRKDTSNYKHLYQALHELYLANNKQEIMSSDMLEQLTIHAQKHGQVQIGIINIEMTIIKEDAYDENDKKIEIDSTNNIKRLHEIPDKNPYKNIQTLVISPTQGNVEEVNGENISFNFNRAFIQKTTNPIKELNVNFGDGQLHSIISNRSFSNSTLTHNFQTEGTKTLKFSGSYQDGTPFETFAQINIAIIPAPITGIVKLRATENFTPYIPDETAYYDNYIPDDEYPEIEYKVYYSTNPPRTKIMKPIIIVDGIDYDDERKINHIYDFALKIQNTNGKLGDSLRVRGYDVIIANFPTYKVGTREIDIITEWDDYGNPEYWDTEIIDVYRKGGADYIQRNAKSVKELIRKINSILSNNGSTEEIVLVGPSMGGLVTRWALKEMEDAGENHNVGIWVSFDSPQQGANIPTALQFAADYQNEYSALDKLKRKASRQMLIHHYLAESSNTISSGAPEFRNRFNTELNSLGYPQNLRKVALVNGSTTGEITNNPGDEIAYTHLWMDSFPWSNILEGYLYFTGNAGHSNVMDFDFTWISGQDDVKKYTDTSYPIGSFDNAPGCIIEMVGDYSIEEEFDNIHETWFVFSFYIDGYVSQSVDNFTFMPTKSTLDYQGSSQLLREPICYNLIETGETPFDSYYAPEHNEPHVQLNTTNVTWLLNELTSPSPTSPPTYCDQPIELSINGQDELCPPNTATYTLTPNNLTNVQWSVTNNLQIISSNNQQVVVKMNYPSQYFSWGNILVNVGQNSASKIIVCVPPHPMFNIDYNNGGNINISLESVIEEIPLEYQNITDVQWELTSGNSIILSATENQAELLGDTVFTGKVTVTNDNGSATKNFFWPEPDKCYALIKVGADRYQVIDRCNDNEVLNSLPIKELYDIYGNKINDIPINYEDLDISNIGSSGQVHVIHININGENISKTIIKD